MSVGNLLLDDSGVYWDPELVKKVNYLIIAGFTLLIYDCLLTFQYEVELIWTKLDRVASIVFILLRYTTIGMSAVAVFDILAPGHHDPNFCKVWIILQAYLSIICFLAVHLVVAIRVNAFHNNNPRIRRLLILCGAVYTLSTFTFFTVTYAKEHHRQINSGEGACLKVIPEYLWIGWVPTVFFETVLFVLTSIHAMKSFPKFGTFRLYYRSLYRDGVIFYLVIVVCSIGSLLVWALAGARRTPWLATAPAFPTCVVEVVATRFIINLRLFAMGAHAHNEGCSDKESSVVLDTSASFHFRLQDVSANGAAPSSAWRGEDDRPS